MRTPLNAIIGFPQLIQMDPQLPADRRAQLGHVLSAGEHLLLLINQILDISSIESGAQTVATQAVPLAPLLETCAAICRPLAQASAVALEVAGPLPDEPDPASVHVQADPTRLRRWSMNLLSNAVKYNRPQGRVRLVVRQDAVGGDGPDVHVDITDSGIGLAPAQLERLFEPFNRVGAERTGVEGHGARAGALACAGAFDGRRDHRHQPARSGLVLHAASAARGPPGGRPATRPRALTWHGGGGYRARGAMMPADDPDTLRSMDTLPSKSADPTASRTARRVALLLNLGHAIDHMFLLIFATAVGAIAAEFGFARWEDLMPYGVGAFVLFGLGSLPSGRLGDLWGRPPHDAAVLLRHRCLGAAGRDHAQRLATGLRR